jgi:phage-related protein (TIGR01555 family)
MVRDLNQSGGVAQPQKVGGVIVQQARSDGWSNVMAGIGRKNADKTTHTHFQEDIPLTDQELSQIYMGDGLAKRIIDLKPKDATRQWITIPGDPNEKILKELKRLDAQSMFTKALSYARLYRGSIIVIVEKGAIDLAKPLQKNPKAIQSLKVYSAARIETDLGDLIDNPQSLYFDDYEYFTVNLRSGVPLTVHRSRCLVFHGEEAPDYGQIDTKYLYWGLPILKTLYNEVKDWGATKKAIANLILEFNVGKYTLSNLAQMLSSNDDSAVELIMQRLEVINMSKSMARSVLLGENESYERDSASVGGLADLLDRIMIDIAALAGYPVTKLWGRSPGGMNATGESDEANYYDDVSSYQEVTIQPPLQMLCNMIGNYLSVTDSELEFNPLKQLNEKDQAEVDNKNANSHNLDIQNGVITSVESRAIRYPQLDQDEGLNLLEGTEED